MILSMTLVTPLRQVQIRFAELQLLKIPQLRNVTHAQLPWHKLKRLNVKQASIVQLWTSKTMV
jgi:hypothetical protein